MREEKREGGRERNEGERQIERERKGEVER